MKMKIVKVIDVTEKYKSALKNKDYELASKIAKAAQPKSINRYCPNCARSSDYAKFDDLASYKESYISGLCNPCQKPFFAGVSDE
jgi:hypothetical protein